MKRKSFEYLIVGAGPAGMFACYELLKKKVDGKKIAFAPLCNSRDCEDKLKFESGGAKVLNIPEKQPSELGKSKCVICGAKADYLAYIGKSY